MVQELTRWINGLVYSLFGVEGLVRFSGHPVVYGGLVLGLLAVAALVLLSWANRQVRSVLHALRRTFALGLSGKGRHCLRLAREIRTGCARLSRTVRSGIAERGERRSLLGLLRHFVREDLEVVLDQVRVAITLSDDRLERSLKASLEAQTRRWAESRQPQEREGLQASIAEIRHRLARVSRVNGERDRLVRGLEEVAAALRSLEEELLGLNLVRNRSLPQVRDRLHELANHLGRLKEAYLELESPPAES
jgi:hypothetical protein